MPTPNPFLRPGAGARYLARYTHRVAISNGRLFGPEDDRMRFRWRDSQDGNQIKEMSLDAVEFIRRISDPTHMTSHLQMARIPRLGRTCSGLACAGFPRRDRLLLQFLLHNSGRAVSP